MNKVFFTIAVSFLLSVAISKANVIGQTINSNSDYVIECCFDETSDVFLIKLKIPVSGIVKVNVTDESENIVETLVDSDMDEGEYKVCFKPEVQFSASKLKCNMKVYSSESGDLHYSNQIKMFRKQ